LRWSFKFGIITELFDTSRNFFIFEDQFSVNLRNHTKWPKELGKVTKHSGCPLCKTLQKTKSTLANKNANRGSAQPDSHNKEVKWISLKRRSLVDCALETAQKGFRRTQLDSRIWSVCGKHSKNATRRTFKNSKNSG
jgi:hypothetical protein